MEAMDSITATAIGIAQHVALRSINPEENANLKRLDQQMIKRSLRAIERIRFADQLRYTIPQSIVAADIRDTLQGINRDALEVYLLCTCLDTLAGKENYIDLPSWLRTNKTTYEGIEQRNNVLAAAFSVPLNRDQCHPLLKKVLCIYHQHYGVIKGIKDMVRSLPLYTKEEICHSFVIHKQSQSEDTWNRKDTDQKLNTIINYFLDVRRNRYTHSADTPPTMGSIRDARRWIMEGKVNLPEPCESIIPWDGKQFLVKCNYGDEALFLRELVYSCIASNYKLLDESWSARFKESNRQYRVLQAIIYEIEYNIKVLQYHTSTLFEGLTFLDGEMPPRLRVIIATAIQNKVDDFQINYMPAFLDSYLELANEFNKEVGRLVTDSGSRPNTDGISHQLRLIRWFVSNLMWDYPAWVYDKDYIYDHSSL